MATFNSHPQKNVFIPLCLPTGSPTRAWMPARATPAAKMPSASFRATSPCASARPSSCPRPPRRMAVPSRGKDRPVPRDSASKCASPTSSACPARPASTGCVPMVVLPILTALAHANASTASARTSVLWHVGLIPSATAVAAAALTALPASPLPRRAVSGSQRRARSPVPGDPSATMASVCLSARTMAIVPGERDVPAACASRCATRTRTAYRARSAWTSSATLAATCPQIVGSASSASVESAAVRRDTSRHLLAARTSMSVRTMYAPLG